MKKVCFFSGDINRGGGTERVGSTIANKLVEKGYIIHFLSLDNGLEPFFELHENIVLNSLGMQYKNKKLNLLSIILKIRKYCVNNSIDTIIGIDVIASLYIVPALVRLKVKYIAWEHFGYQIKVGNALQNFQRKIGRKLSCEYADVLVTLTQGDFEIYQKHCDGKAKIIKIYNPVSFKESKTLNLKNKTVLAVGRLTEIKGFDVLLRLWKELARKYNDWTLYIVGSGEQKAELTQLCDELLLGNNVKLIPHTNDVEYYYNNSSIYALSSYYESFGLVLLEAKAFGLPIVSFKCSAGPLEIIKDNADGFLVDKGDTKAFASKLELLMLDENLRVKMGRNALNEQRFKLDEVIKQWVEIL